jgi:2,3-dihydroxybenzoate decarboxylase
MRPMWGWGFETGSHALRLIISGHFDRFPLSKLMLGHLGETLPFLLWRFDSRAKFHGLKLKKAPSEYIRENVIVTTSGMCSAEPLSCTISALGPDRVMFAADHPFEQADEAGHFMDTVPLSDKVRGDICVHNAVRLLGLP